MGALHPLAPSPAEFVHFCIDALTAETLLHVVDAVVMREPCLLEGDTSTAKTSSVLYVAAQVGQPVVRINLHGQTDTGELVGRFVPNDGASGDTDAVMNCVMGKRATTSAKRRPTDSIDKAQAVSAIAAETGSCFETASSGFILSGDWIESDAGALAIDILTNRAGT